MSLNKVMLIGNVGRDPEVRYLEGTQGRKVATFTLATSERYKDRGGELRENTEWHNIVAWGQSADVAEKFIRKGTQLYIEGRLRTRSWTDQQGVKKYTTEINVDNLQLLGRRENGQEGGYQQGGYQPAAPQQPQTTYQRSAPQQYAAPSQPQYAAPAQPAFQAPVQTPAQQPAAPQPFDLNVGADNPDDLPF